MTKSEIAGGQIRQDLQVPRWIGDRSAERVGRVCGREITKPCSTPCERPTG